MMMIDFVEYYRQRGSSEVHNVTGVNRDISLEIHCNYLEIKLVRKVWDIQMVDFEWIITSIQ